jgi:serine/threonine protein phosphatase PrpC
MSRSISEHAVKDVDVIARPVVTMHVIDWVADKFMIMATDGVWEFLSSKDAIDIVGRHLYGEIADDYNKIGKGCRDNDDYANISEARNGGGDGGGGGARVACKVLIKAALAKWHDYKGDYCNDVTAIIIRLKDLWGQ